MMCLRIRFLTVLFCQNVFKPELGHISYIPSWGVKPRNQMDNPLVRDISATPAVVPSFDNQKALPHRIIRLKLVTVRRCDEFQ